MNDTPPAGHAARADAQELLRELRELLADKTGIDESRAKRLRKKWEAMCARAEAGGENAHAESATTEHAQGETTLAENARSESACKDSARDETTHAELTAKFAELRERVHAQVARRDSDFAEAESHLQKLREAVARGDTSQAKKCETTLQRALENIPGLSEQRRKKITGALQELRPDLQELAASQKSGAQQARESLIEEIRNIHGGGESLPHIAQRIQRAREQWKKWDTETGAGISAKLYEEFDAECSKAYLPCQEFFDRKKVQRDQNTTEREELCAQIEAETAKFDRRNPDWKRMRKLANNWRLLWRKTRDSKSRKSLQTRFTALMENFEAPLAREQARNYKMREQLAEQADALAKSGDPGAALGEYARLKKNWVVTAASQKRQERALWRRFITAGEKLHAKRKLEIASRESARRETLTAREELCAQMESACASKSNGGGGDLRAQIKTWETKWRAFGEDAADAKKVRARYHAALTAARAAATCAERAAQHEMQNVLRDKAEICAQVEARALAKDSACEKLAARWKELPALPAEIEESIGARYAAAVAACGDAGARETLRAALPANLENAHALLLQLEILCEVESPREFAKQRMALQIERLSAAMGKGACAAKTAEQLVREIFLTGAVEENARAKVTARLDACRAAQKAADDIAAKKAAEKKSAEEKSAAKKSGDAKPTPKKSRGKTSTAKKPRRRKTKTPNSASRSSPPKTSAS